MFYGRANEMERELGDRWLVDLQAFGAALIRSRRSGNPILCGSKFNPDGTLLMWFDFRSFPNEPPLVAANKVESATPE